MCRRIASAAKVTGRAGTADGTLAGARDVRGSSRHKRPLLLPRRGGGEIRIAHCRRTRARGAKAGAGFLLPSTNVPSRVGRVTTPVPAAIAARRQSPVSWVSVATSASRSQTGHVSGVHLCARVELVAVDQLVAALKHGRSLELRLVGAAGREARDAYRIDCCADVGQLGRSQRSGAWRRNVFTRIGAGVGHVALGPRQKSRCEHDVVAPLLGIARCAGGGRSARSRRPTIRRRPRARTR